MKPNIQKLAQLFVTNRDAYNGISYEAPLELPNNILVFTRTTLRPSDYKNTVHHRYVLIFFITGSGSLFVDNNHYNVQENQALLILPFQQHYYAPPSQEIEWLFISFELAETHPFGAFQQSVSISELMRSSLRELLTAYHTGAAQKTATMLSCILYELAIGKAAHPVSPSTGQIVIAKINTYIHQHLDEPFTLDDLARHCAFSVSHLRTQFKNAMGISLGHYVHSVRINHAIKLLLRTRLTVSEIAYQSGFSSPAIFCRAFKKEIGISPLKFRKKQSASAK
ncbi:helix-turn-helix domain-containing protein [Tichowtungia aerotolerans]|uniref:AraC family transcriptional regulator n=1 Tax=Tichowtungia aerotolerans TaxID=2697043 RepID=A0A6P1M725_9BACT|nr:AraC family transcriptional regulator [Tichowtungia aerotolerans]QHI70390.1 AraC family transcriptional regulator [Tichowtungia aerotolerans]